MDPIQSPPLCSVSPHAGLSFVQRRKLLWARQQSDRRFPAAEASRPCLRLLTSIANIHDYLFSYVISARLDWPAVAFFPPPVTNRSVNSATIQTNTGRPPQEPPGTQQAAAAQRSRSRGGDFMDFSASLTIYELPLHVIYTGLMAVLFGAQTQCGDPLG